MGTLRENVARESPQLPLWTTSERIERQFAEHRAQHPEVYRDLLHLAREALVRGRKRMGIAALFEILRWERGKYSTDAEGFKINNTLRALYARALMDEHPELRGFFETRTLRSVN